MTHIGRTLITIFTKRDSTRMKFGMALDIIGKAVDREKGRRTIEAEITGC